MDISASVIPRLGTKARVLKSCPKNEMKTVTNESSIVLASAAQRSDAVPGGIRPAVVIVWPAKFMGQSFFQLWKSHKTGLCK